MQVDRLFSIVYLLLSRESVTAGELAKRFEVSSRTIYRDIDTLSAAGVPVYAVKGRSGGIRLMDRFTMGRSLLSEEEQGEILSALGGLQATGALESDMLLQKLSAVFHHQVRDWIAVDFSDWDSKSGRKFEQLKMATLRCRVISFDYYGSSGEHTKRIVEPVQLRFKHRAWYLAAYCRERQAERLFKLSRIRELTVLEEEFPPRAPAVQEVYQGMPPFLVKVKLRIDLSLAHRVYDEFEEEQIQRRNDCFLVDVEYPLGDWVFEYLLSFGPFAQVLEPEEIRDEMMVRLRRSLEKYGELVDGKLL